MREKRNFNDLIGKTFGIYTVKCYSRLKNKQHFLIIKCNVCGKEIEKQVSQIKNRLAKRCYHNKYDSCVFQQYLRIKNRAKYRKIKFTLSLDDFKFLAFKNCHYCGSPPNRHYGCVDENIYINGIDRVNSKFGYIKENCVSCCSICNKAKYTMSEFDYYNWIDGLVKYRLKNCPELYFNNPADESLDDYE